MASREDQVVVVEDLGSEIVQAHRILVTPATLLHLDEHLLLGERTVVFGTYRLLIDLFLLLLESLEEVIMDQQFALLLKFSIVEVQQTLECHKSEQELLFIQAQFLRLVVLLDSDLFGHPCDSAAPDGLQTLHEHLVGLPPRVSVANLLVA